MQTRHAPKELQKYGQYVIKWTEVGREFYAEQLVENRTGMKDEMEPTSCVSHAFLRAYVNTLHANHDSIITQDIWPLQLTQAYLGESSIAQRRAQMGWDHVNTGLMNKACSVYDILLPY